MPIDILMMSRMNYIERQMDSDFVVHHLPPESERATFLKSVEERIRGIITYSGSALIDRPLLEHLPKVEIIANMGVGYESIDMNAARDRNIIVTNAGAANAVDVAEHAFGLILDVGRAISFGDRHVRTGAWISQGRIKPTRRVSGRKLGIVGLGNIGLEIAKRAEAFDMPVSYHNRKPRTDVPYAYVDDVVTLARNVDVLAVATPGGAATHHLINRAVIDALGAEGVLVNVGRGSTVDEKALIEALQEGRLGGAGLDVFENEPNVPQSLLSMPNVVVQPHVGGATHEGIAAAVGVLVQNLRLHFAGEPVLTPV